MQFHVRLTHSPDNCWARDEQAGKAADLVARLEDAHDSFGVTVRSALVAPNEHTFFFLLEAESFEAVTALLGPPLLQDHAADIVPVTTFAAAMDATDVE